MKCFFEESNLKRKSFYRYKTSRIKASCKAIKLGGSCVSFEYDVIFHLVRKKKRGKLDQVQKKVLHDAQCTIFGFFHYNNTNPLNAEDLLLHMDQLN